MDSRRYTQFEQIVTDSGTADLKFSDLVDMFNPLEHIPVLSSIYRSIVGEEINPVSRVVGDVVYGGVFGIGSAVLGGMGAVADAELAQGTGKDSSGQIIAALFGPDDDKQNPIQLADAASANTSSAAKQSSSNHATTQKIELAQNTTPAMTAAMAIAGNAPSVHSENTPSPALSSIAAIPDQTPRQENAETSNTETSANPAAPSPPAPPKPDGASPSIAPSGTIPLLASTGTKSSKQPFGGVMGQPNTQAQDMAIALAQGAPSMKLGHMIYTNPLINGQHPLPPMLSTQKQPIQNAVPGNLTAATPASLTSPTAADPMALLNAMSLSGTNGATGMSAIPTTQLSPELSQDMMLKALSQYRSMAGLVPVNPAACLISRISVKQ